MLTKPCVSMSLVTVAPLGPITRPSASLGTKKDRILGMLALSGRGSDSAARMFCRMLSRPRLACARLRLSVSMVRPSDLMSSWKVVMPVSLPATLKSMVPRASSRPRMSVRMTGSSPSFSPRMRPMATPATDVDSGTPASSMARQQPQTVAMEDEPQLSVMRLSALML